MMVCMTTELPTTEAGWRPAPPGLVGMVEIADRLGVLNATVHSWHHTGKLPEPDYELSGRPVWRWKAVEAWAKKTGRLR